ncbi:hypothetical protein [Paenibacillus sp. 1001270B_150601_E10]|uniref:hypothetical protein n=1 Tax=Paenibacillus sp. 1001270B_150601_E10 TaxID=2787079 RepID=UPI0018A11258|nr:hypothetical protein [Paenibacillus sp. 1001270B_150601_E10]
MKKVIRVSIALLFIILLISVGYAFYVYHSIEKTVSKMQIPSEESNQTALEKRDAHNFLLLGIGDCPNIGDAS